MSNWLEWRTWDIEPSCQHVGQCINCELSIKIPSHFRCIGISIWFHMGKIGSSTTNVIHTILLVNVSSRIFVSDALRMIELRNRKTEEVGRRWRSLYVGWWVYTLHLYRSPTYGFLSLFSFEEFVDSTNVIQTTWPRASVVAERLWSSADVKEPKAAIPRLEEQRCRYLKRGIPAAPINGPSSCNVVNRA